MLYKYHPKIWSWDFGPVKFPPPSAAQDWSHLEATRCTELWSHISFGSRPRRVSRGPRCRMSWVSRNCLDCLIHSKPFQILEITQTKQHSITLCSICHRSGEIKVLKKIVIHFQAFWGTDGPELEDVCVCVWVCVCVCVLVFIHVSVYLICDLFVVCMHVGAHSPWKITNESVAQEGGEAGRAPLVGQDFFFAHARQDQRLAHSRKNLAFEGLHTHTGQDDDGPSLELDVDDEPIIIDVKAWVFTFSSSISTLFFKQHIAFACHARGLTALKSWRKPLRRQWRCKFQVMCSVFPGVPFDFFLVWNTWQEAGAVLWPKAKICWQLLWSQVFLCNSSYGHV